MYLLDLHISITGCCLLNECESTTLMHIINSAAKTISPVNSFGPINTKIHVEITIINFICSHYLRVHVAYIDDVLTQGQGQGKSALPQGEIFLKQGLN